MVKIALCIFQQSLGPFAMFVVEDTSKMGFHRHSFNHLFRKRKFAKCIGYEGRLFFENVQNFMYISKMDRIIEQKPFDSGIIVSELVALNCLYKQENISHRQSMTSQTVLRICRALT